MGRAGRFGTKGLSISFVSSEEDKDVMKAIEKRFEVAVPYVSSTYVTWIKLADSQSRAFPEGGVDASTYMATA